MKRKYKKPTAESISITEQNMLMSSPTITKDDNEETNAAWTEREFSEEGYWESMDE